MRTFTLAFLLMGGCTAATGGSLTTSPSLADLESRVAALEAGSATLSYEWLGLYDDGATYFTRFNANSGGVPTGWTEYDPDADTTVVEGDAGVLITPGPAVTGMYRAIPAGDVRITAHLYTGYAGLDWDGGGSVYMGLAEDVVGAPTTANQVGIRFTTNTQIYTTYTLSAYNAVASTPDNVEGDSDLMGEGIFLQACVSDTGSTTQYCVSHTGRDFACSATVTYATSGTPLYVILSGVPAVSKPTIWDMYRVDSGTCGGSVGALDDGTL